MPCPGNRSDPCRTAPAQVRAAFRQERNEARGMCQQEPLTHPLRSVPACPPRKRAARARRLRRPSWLVCARRSRERTGFDFDVPRSLRESVGCVYALLQGRAEMDFNRWTSMSGTTSEYTQYDVDPTVQIFCLASTNAAVMVVPGRSPDSKITDLYSRS